MTPELRYFRSEGVVTRFEVTVTGSSAPFLPADPMRYCIVIPNIAGSDLYLWSGITYTTGTSNIHVPDGNGPVVLTEDVIGELIRRDWTAIDGQGNSNTLGVLTVSYEARKWDQMRRWTHARLSQYISL